MGKRVMALIRSPDRVSTISPAGPTLKNEVDGDLWSDAGLVRRFGLVALTIAGRWRPLPAVGRKRAGRR